MLLASERKSVTGKVWAERGIIRFESDHKGQYISKKGKEENRVGKTGGRRGAIHCAHLGGRSISQGAMNCAPTPISSSHSPSLKCIDHKGSPCSGIIRKYSVSKYKIDYNFTSVNSKNPVYSS